jgi:hypothetical protein
MVLNFKLNKSADFIFDYLTNMDKFTSIHPVISKIELLGENKYRVYETLKFGFIPFSFTYPVSINSNSSDKSIIMHATVMKINKIEINYKIKEISNISFVEEKITIRTVLPIHPILKLIFIKQHTQLFKNIEALK